MQSKPSRFPLSSDELFTILDDASEKNTFYGVTSSSMQRHVFESEHGKVGFEAKNLVASLGFLVELKLVRKVMLLIDFEHGKVIDCKPGYIWSLNVYMFILTGESMDR